MRITTTLAVGPAELEVPVSARVTFHRGGGDGWNEPREPDWWELDEVDRTDGLQWNDAVQDAWDQWWDRHGQAECDDESAAEADYAAEAEWQRDRDDRQFG